MICSLQSRHLKSENFEGRFFVSHKLKVDLNSLLIAFDKYEDGLSFANIVDELNLDIHSSVLRNKYYQYLDKGMESLIPKSNNNSYSKEFKMKVVDEYFHSGLSYRDLAIKYNVPSHQTIINWTKRYTEDKENQNYSSISEMYTMKARKTTYEERLNIVNFYLGNELSYKKIAQKFNVTYGQVYQWVQKYKKHGSDGLIDGRGKGKPQSILTSEEVNEAEIKALKERNKILEMENKVLKKYQEIEREMMNQKSNKSRHTKRSKR